MKSAKFHNFDMAHDLRNTEGAVAFVFVDDPHWVTETLEHLERHGFARVYAVGKSIEGFLHQSENVVWLDLPQITNKTAVDILNSKMADLTGHWTYYCFNGEFFHFPFDETRKIDDFTSFLAEERRITALSTKIDLYPATHIEDLNTLGLGQCWLDRVGYYSNTGKDRNGRDIDNSLNILGGFRWRLSEFLPDDSQGLNRNTLFLPHPNLKMQSDFRFESAEYETAHARWHRSPTTVTASIRAYKYLREQNNAEEIIGNLRFRGSSPYQKRAQQFMELGFMEPGQWF